jgi:hypothetical protein
MVSAEVKRLESATTASSTDGAKETEPEPEPEPEQPWIVKNSKRRQREKRVTLKRQLTAHLLEEERKELDDLAKAKSINESKRQQAYVCKVYAVGYEGTRTHLPESDWVAILPVFGKLFLETVKAIWEMRMYELIYYGNGENFGITQKRFGLYNEANVGRGKQLSTCVRMGHGMIFTSTVTAQTIVKSVMEKADILEGEARWGLTLETPNDDRRGTSVCMIARDDWRNCGSQQEEQQENFVFALAILGLEMTPDGDEEKEKHWDKEDALYFVIRTSTKWDEIIEAKDGNLGTCVGRIRCTRNPPADPCSKKR